MPGYLMDMMVLIETDNWLGQIVTTLGNKDKKSVLETKVLSLASQARQYLHFDYDPKVATEHFPEVSPALIKNNIGSGITQYAFMGAIGPDFPAAGNILALNHGWIATTMHTGAPRQSLKNAGTTTFVKNCMGDDVISKAIEAIGDNKDLSKEYKKPIMAYLLGHLSSIATHVLVEPFINQWAWKDDNSNRSQFAVQLDAQIAKGYFQRDDLRSGQSWKAYLPDIGYLYFHGLPKGVRLITEMYHRGFQKTYGSNPREDLSNFPKAYKKKNLTFGNTKLSKALDKVYTGYADLLKDSTDEDKFKETVESNKDLKDLLTEYEAKTPNVGPDLEDDLSLTNPNDKHPDPPFLIDGYRNTRNWALGWGYDRSPSLPWPPWRFSIIMSLAVLYGSIGPWLDLGVTETVWKEVTNGVVTSPPGIGAVTTPTYKSTAWIGGGMFGNHLMYHDALDKSYGVSGSILWVFNSVLSGVQICDIWQTGRGTTPGKSTKPGQEPARKGEKTKEEFAGIATLVAIGGFEAATVVVEQQAPGAIAGEVLGVEGFFGLVMLFASQLNVKRLTDGMFGEGTDAWKEWWLLRKDKWRLKLVNFLKSPGFAPPIKGWLDLLDDVADLWPPTLPQIWAWFSLTINITLDAFDFRSEHEDLGKGQEGDRLQRQLWFLQWWMTGAYFLSSLLVFGVKAADDSRTAAMLDTRLRARDYLLSLIFPVLLIAFKVWYEGGFEGELLKSITGIDWPSTDTDKVDSTILPIETDATGRKVFSTTRAQKLQVRVFANDDTNVMKKTPLGGDNRYYPQDAEVVLSADTPKRDDQARARTSKSTQQTYALADILERAKFLSGVLAMAAVNHDSSADKQCVDQIFLDWNLNLRTDDEWNALMEARPDGTPGFAKAAQQWWEAISKGLDPDPSAVVQMEIMTCLKPGPAKITGQIEDRTVAPNNAREDTAHIFLGNKVFKIVDANGKDVTFVDANGNTVTTGTTDELGQFSITLPGPAEYELRVDGYQGI